MNVVIRDMDIESDWAGINHYLPLLLVEDTRGLVAVDEATGKPLAAFVMNTWSDSSVQCHITVVNPMVLRHGFLEACCHYVFVHGDRQIMYATIVEDNLPSLKLVKRIGFTERARLPDGCEIGRDNIIMEMRKEDCRFLPGYIPRKDREGDDRIFDMEKARKSAERLNEVKRYG